MLSQTKIVQNHEIDRVETDTQTDAQPIPNSLAAMPDPAGAAAIYFVYYAFPAGAATMYFVFLHYTLVLKSCHFAAGPAKLYSIHYTCTDKLRLSSWISQNAPCVLHLH